MSEDYLVNRNSKTVHRRLEGAFVNESCNTDDMTDFFTLEPDDKILAGLESQGYHRCLHCHQDIEKGD